MSGARGASVPIGQASGLHRHTVTVTRRFEAPRERVFDCWTRAEHLAHWFGPAGFVIHSVEADPRPGGAFRLCLRSPGGADYWVRGSYVEVEAPSRLVVQCLADDARGVERLSETITVTLADAHGGTRLTLRAEASGAGEEAARMLGGMTQGWHETLDRLHERSRGSVA
ncbi:MAG TPA: SRPBCC domain-containing protein [Burkholderiales bacterium]|nr:SRPBCC domain-containing protein [Burkholderiales bacterium]